MDVCAVEDKVRLARSQADRRRRSAFGVARDVLLVLALEFSDEVLQQASVEIFAAQVRVASRRLDFEDAFFDGQQRHIEGTATEIEDQNVLLSAVGLRGACPNRTRSPRRSVR